jgi:hypothetical protein
MNLLKCPEWAALQHQPSNKITTLLPARPDMGPHPPGPLSALVNLFFSKKTFYFCNMTFFGGFLRPRLLLA